MYGSKVKITKGKLREVSFPPSINNKKPFSFICSVCVYFPLSSHSTSRFLHVIGPFVPRFFFFPSQHALPHLCPRSPGCCLVLPTQPHLPAPSVLENTIKRASLGVRGFESLLTSTGDMGSVPGPGRFHIPCAATAEPTCHNY